MSAPASVQRITSLRPIPGADAIEAATVLGWTVVVKRGEYVTGDLALYVALDAVPPDTLDFAFLWKSDSRPSNYRIRTVKLRGQISQGLLVPLSVLPPKVESVDGLDVTDVLGVGKYVKPLPAGDVNIVGDFLPGVPKTDEERVQNVPHVLAELQGQPYVITEKLDGCSMTVGWYEDRFVVCSRNYRLRDELGSAYWQAARDAGLPELYNDAPWLRGIALQGELCGTGIQGNSLALTRPTFFLFNVVHDGVRLGPNRVTYWSPIVGVPTVPVLERGDSFTYTQDELLARAEGKYTSGREREGIVVRADTFRQEISFKVISNRFLLKGGE